MMKKIRVAIIGGGWFGHYHLDNLLLMEEVEVVAMATRRIETLQDAKQKVPHLHLYSSQEELLKHENNLDALVVALPPHAHNNIERLAANKKIHLYVEKPLGIDAKTIKENVDVIRKSGILCSVGYQTRYNSICEIIKDSIEHMKVGAVSGIWNGVMPPPLWWRDNSSSGGQLHEQATHIVDLLRYFFGDITSVYSAGSQGLMTAVPHYHTQDMSISIFTFASGLISSIQCGCFVDEKTGVSDIGFSIYGDLAQIDYVWDEKATIKQKASEQTYFFGNTFHYTALSAFIKAVQTGDGSLILSTYEDAYKTFLATYAASISLERNKIVYLDELM